jgi:hypothetical protein
MDNYNVTDLALGTDAPEVADFYAISTEGHDKSDTLYRNASTA